MTESVAITKTGYDKLTEELRALLIKRKDVADEISVARSKGDLSENAEYHAALEKQSYLERKIAEFDLMVSGADIVDPADIDTDVIVFGATVDISDMDGNKRKYQIVSAYEADVAKGTVSISSPLARAMLDRRIGDMFVLNTPKGETVYKVDNIEYK